MSTKTSETLPTVLDVMRDEDRDLLAQEFRRCFEHSHMRMPDMPATQAWLNRLMGRLERVRPADDDRELVMVGHELIVEDERPDHFAIQTCATLYDIDDIATALEADALPIGYAYEFNAWAETLFRPMFVPKRFSDVERTQMVADMIWSITFLGDEERLVERAVEAIWADIEDATSQGAEEATLPIDDAERPDERTVEWASRMESVRTKIQSALEEERMRDLKTLVKKIERNGGHVG